MLPDASELPGVEVPSVHEIPSAPSQPGKSPLLAIERIRSMKGVGIFANRTARDARPNFKRYNLIYGFNGSGKSTLTRIFASLQEGQLSGRLPVGSTFEIEMQDGIVFSTNNLSGVEKHICVFNGDFIAEHLQWERGVAKSIFYISKEQAEVAELLRVSEAELPAREAAKSAAEKIVHEREKALKIYCTERAKAIYGALQLGSRKYEASHLKGDYEKLTYSDADVLHPTDLRMLQDLVRLSAPSPALPPIADPAADGRNFAQAARHLAETSIGLVVLEELEKHPSMVAWIKQGHDYHAEHDLESCLLCGNALSRDRKEQLAAALDDKIATLLSELQKAERDGARVLKGLIPSLQLCPKLGELDVSLQSNYETALADFKKHVTKANHIIERAARAVTLRLAQPTTKVDHGLPDSKQVEQIFVELETALSTLNRVIERHNKATKDFNKRQEDARVSIRKHFLAEGHVDYTSMKDTVASGQGEVSRIAIAIDDLVAKISRLRAQIWEHGPAAAKLTKLVQAYLGHGELAIVAVDEGYELHRNGKLVEGAPSEGEKTAIALCYFLCMLESEGREIKNLIVVIDDPISSLDTKAMNYACALVKSRVEGAAQVFVLTHNQHCMNEFKKAWKGRAYPRNKDTAPTATLLFLDVALPSAQGSRCSDIIEMSPLLREYDSEYHFLCQKLLEFEEVGTAHSSYGFMMPNVIRRVMDVFLAFKVPGTASLADKLQQLCKLHSELDPTRLSALERLSQVESHSDNLDDLIAYSSMTIEEARDANAALLKLMEVTDGAHASAIRKQCKPYPRAA